VVRATRALTPKVIVDRHVPVVAFFVLFWIWIALQVLKRHLCALHGLAC
jgi:ABC-type nitrate/sulfonate/bicarbonate transport system permease component